MNKFRLPVFALISLMFLNSLLTACASSVAAEATPPAPSWGLIDGVFTDANGNEVDLTELAARTTGIETADGEMVVVEVNGTVVTDGAEVIPGQSVKITMTIPTGKNVFGFPGGNTGGAWVKNAVVSGADGCDVYNMPSTLQFNCTPSNVERTVVISATATKDFFLPAPANSNPYSTLVINPSPDGAEAYYTWQGVWWEATHTNYLPIVQK